MDLIDLEIKRTEHRAAEEGISPAMVAQKALDASTGQVQLQDRWGLGCDRGGGDRREGGGNTEKVLMEEEDCVGGFLTVFSPPPCPWVP